MCLAANDPWTKTPGWTMCVGEVPSVRNEPEEFAARLGRALPTRLQGHT